MNLQNEKCDMMEGMRAAMGLPAHAEAIAGTKERNTSGIKKFFQLIPSVCLFSV